MTGRKKISLVKALMNKKVLVVGDFISDVTTTAECVGLSLETPTLKATETCTTWQPGGAANVVKNILELGASCTFLTLVGNANHVPEIFDWYHPKLNLHYVHEKKRKNAIKPRFWITRGEGLYKYFQLNTANESKVDDISYQSLLKEYSGMIATHDVVLLVDYNLGVLSDNQVVKTLIKLAHKNSKFLIASSQISDGKTNHHSFANASLICLNEEEAGKNVMHFQSNAEGLNALKQELHSNVCVTLGSHGSQLHWDNKIFYADGFAINAIDTCGAGDAFLAALTLTDLDADPDAALQIANAWAALSTLQLGTECTTFDQLERFLEDFNNA